MIYDQVFQDLVRAAQRAAAARLEQRCRDMARFFPVSALTLVYRGYDDPHPEFHVDADKLGRS